MNSLLHDNNLKRVKKYDKIKWNLPVVQNPKDIYQAAFLSAAVLVKIL